MSQITLTLDLTPENVSTLCEMLPRLTLTGAAVGNNERQLSFFGDAANEITGAEVSEDKSKTSKDKKESKAAAKSEPKKEEAAESEPAPEPEPEPESKAPSGKAPSMTDIRAVALKLSKAGKQDVLKKIFAKYDADKLSAVAEKHYANLMKDLEAANAEA